MEFNAELKKFQELDVSKLAASPYNLNCNEMGLGKTFEALALDYLFRKHGPRNTKTLVVTPLSAVWSWEEHVKNILGLKAVVLNPKKRSEFFIGDGADADFYIMHWDAIRLMPELKNKPWNHIIADEAHYICNRKAAVSRHFKKIKAPYKSALTGTPIEERPDQFWSILNWLDRKKFSAYWKFFKHFSEYAYEDKYGNPIGYARWIGPKNLDELHETLEPFFVRHLKKERCCPMHPNGALPEMPAKYYSKIKVNLAPTQRRRYNEMRDNMLTWVGPEDDQALISPIHISKLVRLAQFANGDCEIITTDCKCVDDDGTNVKEPNLDCDKCGGSGTIESVKMTEPSAKLDAFMEWRPDEPIVVFSQFRQMINLLEKRCLHSTKPHIRFAKITGEVGTNQRRAIIEQFQDGEIDVLGIVDRAGGTGITLHRSKTVVFLDRNKSSKVNLQAEDRVHRIGQNDNVQVVDFLARNTINLEDIQRLKTKAEFRKAVLGA